MCFTPKRVSEVGDAAKLEACLPGNHIPAVLYKALQCPSLILVLRLLIFRASDDITVLSESNSAYGQDHTEYVLKTILVNVPQIPSVFLLNKYCD